MEVSLSNTAWLGSSMVNTSGVNPHRYPLQVRVGRGPTLTTQVNPQVFSSGGTDQWSPGQHCLPGGSQRPQPCTDKQLEAGPVPNELPTSMAPITHSPTGEALYQVGGYNQVISHGNNDLRLGRGRQANNTFFTFSSSFLYISYIQCPSLSIHF